MFASFLSQHLGGHEVDHVFDKICGRKTLRDAFSPVCLQMIFASLDACWLFLRRSRFARGVRQRSPPGEG